MNYPAASCGESKADHADASRSVTLECFSPGSRSDWPGFPLNTCGNDGLWIGRCETAASCGKLTHNDEEPSIVLRASTRLARLNPDSAVATSRSTAGRDPGVGKTLKGAATKPFRVFSNPLLRWEGWFVKHRGSQAAQRQQSIVFTTEGLRPTEQTSLNFGFQVEFIVISPFTLRSSANFKIGLG